jgi:hypothetical protein
MSLLIESSIRAVLVAGAVAAVVYALRIANPRAKHLAWCGVLAAMLLLPAFCAWGPKATLRILPQVDYVSADAEWAPIDTVPSEPRAVPPMPGRPDPMPAPAAKKPTPDAVWIVYLLVAGFFLMRLAYGAAHAVCLRKRARPEAGFFSSAKCACPIALGWWRPAIVLPSNWAEWPKAELDAILAHERGHVRRRDPLVQSLAVLNRCIFWFHPLAWWLEHKLSALAEEACDSAVIASGHDAHDYSEYLIHQARAVERAGARIALSGAAIGGGGLSHRIRRLLDDRPTPAMSRSRAILGTVACVLAIAAFTACRLDRAEKPAPGQPAMHELAQRLNRSTMQDEAHRKLIQDRARALTAREAEQLFARLKQDPQDADSYWTLVRHYEFKADVQGRDELALWYIEHQPAGKLWGENIDPRIDPAGYEKGKALWLANLKRPGASAGVYRRAAEFLEGDDRPLAGSVLRAGRKAFPDDKDWPRAFGQHYANVLIGAAEPLYAQAVRAELAGSRDARVLAQTAQWLVLSRPAGEANAAALQLARTYVDRALSIEPELELVQRVKLMLAQTENVLKLQRLTSMAPAELAAAPAAERMLVALFQMRTAAMRQQFGDAETKARELLDLAGRNRNDPLYGEALFQANMVMGKAALHRNDTKAAVRGLLAAAETTGSDEVRRGEFDMNLPRALVDRGQRRAVIDFLQRMAPKTRRAKQFQEWAAELSKGVNPDMLPIFTAPGCTNDPC